MITGGTISLWSFHSFGGPNLPSAARSGAHAGVAACGANELHQGVVTDLAAEKLCSAG